MEVTGKNSTQPLAKSFSHQPRMKKYPTKKGIGKKVVAGTIVTLAVAGAAGWWTINSGEKTLRVPAHQAIKVVDGDTFVTSENQIIRLASVDTPAIENCGGKEAQQLLVKLISGKPLYLKVLFNDQFKRLISDVYTPDGPVNEMMLASGWAYYARGIGRETDQMRLAGESARKKELGVFGKCVEKENLKQPKCIIKAQGSTNNAGDLYRFPGCGQYESTIVQTYLGDEWFCTEKEALKAGYTKASDCFNQNWK